MLLKGYCRSLVSWASGIKRYTLGGRVNVANNGSDVYSKAEAVVRIDIDKLSEEELIDLNNRIVERLRFLNQMRAHSQMLDFKIGDRVTFQPEGRPLLDGMLTRYNRKTVTVITDNGQHWNVSPGLLRKAESPDSTGAGNPKVVRLRKE
jgi:hypothetical protein